MIEESVFLFRVRLFERRENDLFDRASREEVLIKSVSNKNLTFFSFGSEWRFGNFEKINDDWCFFRVGKTHQEKNEKYESGEYSEATVDIGFSSKIIMNVKTGVMAVFQNRNLADNTNIIAKRIGDLINFSEIAAFNGYDVVVKQIFDTKNFIELINSSEKIHAITITCRQRNHPDIGMFFHEQLEEGVEIFNGEEAKTTISGNDLAKEPILEALKSTAQTGDTVSVKMKLPNQRRSTWRSFEKKYPAKIILPESASNTESITEIVNCYNGIGNEN
ncbi:hypothetical protein HQN60_05650 [Deefgea piscis]|uniref:Uncharacterized protein n=1 Tax=Deefgea piscis TaxID=2739061 RepID=A0A6M8SS16_9NEIS|nr:hypothetical protein [Deefgea piscis]QKJ66240.1 hypothetical protein HQN60_05650 [Deefgea piscis]